MSSPHFHLLIQCRLNPDHREVLPHAFLTMEELEERLSRYEIDGFEEAEGNIIITGSGPGYMAIAFTDDPRHEGFATYIICNADPAECVPALQMERDMALLQMGEIPSRLMQLMQQALGGQIAAEPFVDDNDDNDEPRGRLLN